MKREIADFVEDIVNAINKATKFVEGMSYEKFVQDDKTIFAVIKAIEVIGEAVKNIPDDVRKAYPEVPWSKNVERYAERRDVMCGGLDTLRCFALIGVTSQRTYGYASLRQNARFRLALHTHASR